MSMHAEKSIKERQQLPLKLARALTIHNYLAYFQVVFDQFFIWIGVSM